MSRNCKLQLFGFNWNSCTPIPLQPGQDVSALHNDCETNFLLLPGLSPPLPHCLSRSSAEGKKEHTMLKERYYKQCVAACNIVLHHVVFEKGG